MPHVAIVGTEGAGKTVFVTVLAKLYSQLRDDGVYMTPMNRATANYIERAWQALCNYEWPPSTPPGELVHLHWQLQLGDDRPLCDLRLVDAPGQDLRLLFGEEQAVDIEQLPTAMQSLVEALQTADVVLCLVNLRDFFGESDPERRLANQWVIRFAMDFLQQHRPCRFGLVFTQVDQYQAERARLGGWSQLAARCLPYVYESYLRGGDVPIFPVAAVNTTRVLTDDDGRPRRVPERGFKCSGYSKLMGWMADALSDVREKAADSKVEAVSSHQMSNLGGWGMAVVAGFLVAVFWLFYASGCTLGVNGSRETTTATPQPPPITWNWFVEDGVLMSDIVLENNSSFDLTNVALEIDVTSPSGESYRNAVSTPSVPAHGSYRWTWQYLPSGTRNANLICDQNR